MFSRTFAGRDSISGFTKPIAEGDLLNCRTTVSRRFRGFMTECAGEINLASTRLQFADLPKLPRLDLLPTKQTCALL